MLLGRSGQLRVGQQCLALGNPFGEALARLCIHDVDSILPDTALHLVILYQPVQTQWKDVWPPWSCPSQAQRGQVT